MPTNPPGDTPPIPPYWSNENDWIVLIEFLPRHDVEDRSRATGAIGHMLAYAQMTDTRMLALIGDPEADAYELLFRSPLQRTRLSSSVCSNPTTSLTAKTR